MFFCVGLISLAGVRVRVWSLLLLGTQSSVQYTSPSCSTGERDRIYTGGDIFAVLSGDASTVMSSGGSDGSGRIGAGLLPPDHPCGEMQVLEVK